MMAVVKGGVGAPGRAGGAPARRQCVQVPRHYSRCGLAQRGASCAPRSTLKASYQPGLRPFGGVNVDRNAQLGRLPNVFFDNLCPWPADFPTAPLCARVRHTGRKADPTRAHLCLYFGVEANVYLKAH